jgi:hypothetical protein
MQRIIERTHQIECPSKEECSKSPYCPGYRIKNHGFTLTGEVTPDAKGRSRRALKRLKAQYPIGSTVKISTIPCKVTGIYSQAAPKYEIGLTGDGHIYPCRIKEKIDSGKAPWIE